MMKARKILPLYFCLILFIKMFSFGRMNLMGGNGGAENLDQPISNFDLIGIPTNAWSDGFCDCFKNSMPSCLLSFCCPCIMWAQIVTRSQIPLLISIKNSLICQRHLSGYGLFIDYYFWSIFISLGIIIVLAVVDIWSISTGLYYLFLIILIVLLGTHAYLVGHSLSAFREKYQLPYYIAPNCLFWDRLIDTISIELCFPCVLSRMARHVFQYDRMDTRLGCFIGDPTSLPPLRPLDGEQYGQFERPVRADQAGLHTGDAVARSYTGAAHRQQAILEQQRQQVFRTQPTNNPTGTAKTTIPVAVPVRQ